MNRPAGALVVIPAKDDSGFYWHAKFRLGKRQKLLRLGRAWIEPRPQELPDAEAWQRRFKRRRGNPPDGFLSAADAQTKMREVIAQAIKDEHEQRNLKDSVRFEYLAQWWLKERQRQAGWKGTTARNYAAMLAGTDGQPKLRGRKPKARIMQAFEGRDVRSITETDVQNFLRGLTADPTLSARSVNAHRNVLRMLFDYAVGEGVRTDNPVAGTSKQREKDLAELVTYSPAQIQAIASELDESQTMKAIVIVAAFTGLRRGELVELRWRDIDFEKRGIHVQRSYVGGVGVDSPKGRRGRSVPLAEQAAEALQEVRRRGFLTGPNDLVFAGPRSSVNASIHLDPGYVSKLYGIARDKAIAKDPTIPKLSFHKLRHCFGTRCAAAGVDVVSIQNWMGHASIKTTQRYMHAAPRDEDAKRLTVAFS